jgi:hypothetical protein
MRLDVLPGLPRRGLGQDLSLCQRRNAPSYDAIAYLIVACGPSMPPPDPHDQFIGGKGKADGPSTSPKLPN